MGKQTLQNFWDKITIYCMNHDEPIPMKIVQNEEVVKSPFYMCGDYVNGKVSCANRLNLDDYQDICLALMDHVASHPFTDLRNYSFPFKGHRHSYRVKVLQYKEKEVRLGIWNRTVLGGKGGS